MLRNFLAIATFVPGLLLLPKISQAEEVQILKDGTLIKQDFGSCKDLLNSFGLLDFNCEDSNVSSASQTNFHDFALCVSVMVDTYPKGNHHYDDFFLAPLHCAESQILRASQDPRFGNCMKTLLPLYYSYETAMLMPETCSENSVLEADHGKILSCLNKRISDGLDLKGSLGAHYSIDHRCIQMQ